ncbi:expressed unknown protein [Seminavis robusta]|uniref:Uncharacterized protein n=1 Tax=Seminavis robusta TaxID=568900 RepID=A0A9N8DMW5_9STRA|nr:expressed unknown protein [Seminavis robusta]|eukprot:Sro215_g089010.1 n/a (271) ;mRNA; r:38521-39422
MAGFHSCCGFPRGYDSVYALVLGIASYLLAISSTWGCYFASVNFVFLNDEPTKYKYIERMSVGLFSYEDKSASAAMTCRLYSDAQIEGFDSALRAARAVGILANILIGSGMIVLLCLSCIAIPKSIIKGVSFVLFLGGLLQGLTFLIYASDALCETCGIYFGSGLAILCVIITLMNSTITYQIASEIEDEEDDLRWDDSFEHEEAVDKEHQTSSSDEEEEDSYIKHKHNIENSHSNSDDEEDYPGATRQIITTIINQDGSRTVEENTVNA